mmetsp:Transcript_12845/g.41558  ORF Transcript_12845/g.41558 Transcript_12845/m.41558 type:complete len:233 (+) Transcript_12845:3-701(+)
MLLLVVLLVLVPETLHPLKLHRPPMSPRLRFLSSRLLHQPRRHFSNTAPHSQMSSRRWRMLRRLQSRLSPRRRMFYRQRRWLCQRKGRLTKQMCLRRWLCQLIGHLTEQMRLWMHRQLWELLPGLRRCCLLRQRHPSRLHRYHPKGKLQLQSTNQLTSRMRHPRLSKRFWLRHWPSRLDRHPKFQHSLHHQISRSRPRPTTQSQSWTHAQLSTRRQNRLLQHHRRVRRRRQR